MLNSKHTEALKAGFQPAYTLIWPGELLGHWQCQYRDIYLLLMGICILSKLHITNTSLCWSFGERMLVYLWGVYVGWSYWVTGMSVCQASGDSTKSLLAIWAASFMKWLFRSLAHFYRVVLF